ncbi:MAG: non-heme iron oxygenase ferredoxin subunit [Novosphingobium sp.]|nr:non-heme iron oxygenase ferredoxin subunit [Novosphingobium sp.]
MKDTVYVRLCETNSIAEDTPVAVEAEGFPPLVAYMVDGEYFVTDNRCTHGEGMLSDGYQEGSTIECPFHGGSFNIRSGEAITFPCYEPVKTYPVRVEDGWISIPAAKPGGN